MKLEGFGLFVCDMGEMIRFYRDVLGFGIRESEDTSNVYLEKDGTLFLLYGQKRKRIPHPLRRSNGAATKVLQGRKQHSHRSPLIPNPQFPVAAPT